MPFHRLHRSNSVLGLPRCYATDARLVCVTTPVIGRCRTTEENTVTAGRSFFLRPSSFLSSSIDASAVNLDGWGYLKRQILYVLEPATVTGEAT